MFSDPHFQAAIARQRQDDIRAAAHASRPERRIRLTRREARRERRAAVPMTTPTPAPTTAVPVLR